MSVARAYAKALFETAQSAKKGAPKSDALQIELEQFSEMISQSRPLKVALEGPATSPKEKAQLVEALTQKMGVSTVTSQFLTLVARKERMVILPEIAKALREVALESQGAVLGKLVSAEPIDESDVDNYAKVLGQQLGKKVAFSTEVDPDLLAGVKLTVSGVTYDGTLRSQLERLREQLVFGGEATQ